VTLPLAADPGVRPVSENAVAAPLGQLRILVVDDNRDAAESLATLLEVLGAETQVACDGLQALELFRSYGPAVVLLDIGMPEMDGYEVARRIRADFSDRRAVLVALTGWGQEDDRRRAKEAGFDHHLIKPADLNALQKLLVSLRG
jgi:CheY-like chemotaxis protein